jgi:hypothetical protein
MRCLITIYDAKALEILNEKTVLTKQIKDIEHKHTKSISTLEPTRDVFLRSSRAAKDFLAGNDTIKREIVETILWNFSMQGENMVQHQFKSPYSILSKVPQNADFTTMRGVWFEVGTFLASNYR